MAVDISFFEKLKELKNRYINEHPDAIRQLEEWEKRVQKLSRDQEYFNQEPTQELYKILKNRIKTHIVSRLQKGRTPEDNRISDAQETECRWMLSMFNADYEKELTTLEELINNEI